MTGRETVPFITAIGGALVTAGLGWLVSNLRARRQGKAMSDERTREVSHLAALSTLALAVPVGLGLWVWDTLAAPRHTDLLSPFALLLLAMAIVWGASHWYYAWRLGGIGEGTVGKGDRNLNGLMTAVAVLLLLFGPMLGGTTLFVLAVVIIGLFFAVGAAGR